MFDVEDKVKWLRDLVVVIRRQQQLGVNVLLIVLIPPDSCGVNIGPTGGRFSLQFIVHTLSTDDETFSCFLLWNPKGNYSIEYRNSRVRAI